jgi:hypothetical protein
MKEFDDSFPPPFAMEVKWFRTVRFDYQFDCRAAQACQGNADAIFTAIHPDFYPAGYPYLLTGVEPRRSLACPPW